MCERRSFVWKTIRKIDKVVGPRTRIHRISNLHHNDQDSAVAVGDVHPHASVPRMRQRIRKGRRRLKRHRTRALKAPNSLYGMTGIARISSAQTSVRARTHAAISVNVARAVTVLTKRRGISDAVSRSDRPASTMSCDGNRCRRDDNVPGRSSLLKATRPVRNRLDPTHATSRGSSKDRRASKAAAVTAICSSVRNRMTIGEMAVAARHNALSPMMNGVVEEMHSLASDARCAARGATMKRPNASRRLDRATSAAGSSVAPCARLPNPRVVAGRT